MLPFRQAIDGLARIPHLQSATEKLNQLIIASKEIEAACAGDGHYEGDGIGADELLPILAFVLAQARIPCLISELTFMEDFMNKALRFELQGCLLTHLQVALAFLKDIDLGKEIEAKKREKRATIGVNVTSPLQLAE